MIQTIQEKRQAQRVLDLGATTAAKQVNRGQGRTAAALLRVLQYASEGRHAVLVVLNGEHAATLQLILDPLQKGSGSITIMTMGNRHFRQDTLSTVGLTDHELVIDHAVIERLEERRITAVRNAIFELEEWQAIATKHQVGA